MKKQILVLSIALGAFTLTAQTTQPTKQKGTQQTGTEQNGTDQNGTQKGTKQTGTKKGNDQNGTQKGNQPNSNQTGQKGMRQSGSEDSEMNSGGITPPSTINDKFNSKNPNMNPNWRMDGDNYSAEYMDKSTNMGRNIVYDRNGNIIRSDNEMSSDGMSYPSSIGDYHNKNFPNEGYKVWQTNDDKGTKWFYTKRKNGTTWFDKDGKYFPGKQGKADQKMEDKSKTK
ncbi:MAG: hypothetical protein H7141_06010 [Burkholderiales bacterium]|nr:hypothetical protein [Bacteroidia bacterium]